MSRFTLNRGAQAAIYFAAGEGVAKIGRMYATEALDPECVKSRLTTTWLGRSIYYYPVVGSTNDLLKEMAARGEPEGTLVITDYQIRGKGRYGRRWIAPLRSALLFSLLFRPDWPASRAAWLTMIASLAAVESIHDITGLTARIKWPNDILLQVDGHWLKVAGLLLEGTFEGDILNTAILGIGINVNVEAQHIPETITPATSLSITLNRPISRLDLMVSFLSHLENHYDNVANGYSPQPAWNTLLETLGKRVQVIRSSLQAPLEGVAEGTDDWGRLLVRDSGGELHAFSAGDVSLRS